MVLVVVLIRSGSRVLKTWFGCQVAEQGTLLDLFNDFSAGKIDNPFRFLTHFLLHRLSVKSAAIREY